MTSSRTHKSILNAKVNLIFYFLSLFLAFFSRKVFLDNLGADFIGLAGTLGNILGYLNLAELGIGSCISFFLYKPLQSNDHYCTEEFMSVFGYLYRCIGLFIMGGALLISLFFPLLFNHTNLSLGIIYFTFFSFLFSSLSAYFINYRQVLLTADQKNYIVAIYFQSANIFKIALQIFLALSYKNIYLWVIIELLFGILGCIILNWKINKEYPWLKTNKNQGKRLLSKYPEIKAKTKQIFIHKFKDFVMRESDELFIFAFVSLKMVAFYGNYILITTKATMFFNSILDSVNAGVGNLVAEGNRERVLSVFWELMTIRHFIAGILCFSIYHFIEPFISLWLGSNYILDHRILILLVVYIYIANSRGVVDIYNHAHGLYSDVWSAWVELIINVFITIAAGLYWGIIGILLGKIISLFIIVILWKPYYLFSSGLNRPVWIYWAGTIRYYLIFVLSFTTGTILINYIPFTPDSDFISWLGFCSLSLVGYVICSAILLWFFAKGSKDSVKRIIRKKI